MVVEMQYLIVVGQMIMHAGILMKLSFIVVLAFVCRTAQGCCSSPCPPWNCQDIQDYGFNTSGVYRVYPGYIRNGFDVWCDMDTDGGGWLVFQRRQDGSVDFNRNFKTYHKGFGDISGEHWLGNRYLHILTSLGFYELRVELTDWEGNTSFTAYDTFKIADSTQDYALVNQGYKVVSKAGNAFYWHRGRPFSSSILNPDKVDDSCGVTYGSGWWFLDGNDCVDTNLNGIYHNNTDPNLKGKGIIWKSWRGRDYSLKGSEMKIRSI